MKTWTKRIVIVGCLYLVKGLLWLAVPAALVAFGLTREAAVTQPAAGQGP